MCEFSKKNSECPIDLKDLDKMCPLKYPLEDPVAMILKHGYSDGFFDIHPDYGFLPTKRPLPVLPERYKDLQHLMDRVPYHCRKDSTTNKYIDEPGLLATPGAIHEACKELPNYIDQVKQETDTFLIAALYRNYVFLTSAYLLEPANHEFVKTGNYGKALRHLPANIAQPLCHVAEKLDVYPWLDYHYAYSLGNWVVRDESKPFTYDNLDMATCFSGRRDEHGFIMVHADINQHSPALITGLVATLQAISLNDPIAAGLGFKQSEKAMQMLNHRRKVMWTASDPTRYNDFRVFIMGSYAQEAIFGEGVIYEGVDDKPRAYRGESGAQDDVVPAMDIFTGVVDFYPDNDLTRYLIDLRTYRPKCVQRFFNDLRARCKNMVNQVTTLVRRHYGKCPGVVTQQPGAVAYLKEKDEGATALDALGWLACCIDQIHEFRHGHWMFVQRYIMANTKYEVASGGTPITTWIPNNIGATLACLDATFDAVDAVMSEYPEAKMSEACLAAFGKVRTRAIKKHEVLRLQQEALKNADWDAKFVYEINGELKETDV